MNRNITTDQRQAVQDTGAGRLEKESQGAPPYRDISFIDRQEGDMNNGELGGNFSKEPEPDSRHDQDAPALEMK